MRRTCGSAALKSSGISCRVALYSGNASCLAVGAAVSKATAMWVGSWVLIRSSSVCVNPNSAEVFTPLDVKMGRAMNAKCAR